MNNTTTDYRRLAIKMMNRQVEAICNIGLSDLPDTSTLANAIDTIEEALENNASSDEIKTIVHELALEFLDEEGFNEDCFGMEF